MHTSEIIPLAPYLATLLYLDDDREKERELGMALTNEHLTRKMVDEVWLCGPRISEGMRGEVELSLKHGIPIICHNPDLEPELEKIKKEFNANSL